MLKRCVFDVPGISPEFSQKKFCIAGKVQDIRRCCGGVGSTVHPQVLIEAYSEALNPSAPIGVALALLAKISEIEKETGTALLD